MDVDPRGRSVLITGAAGGLGHLLAQRVAAAGGALGIYSSVDRFSGRPA